MPLQILYFGSFRERLGLPGETLDAPLPGTVSELTAWLAERGDVWRDVFAGSRPVMAAVNEQMVTPDTPLRAGDTVALFPRVTGG